MTDTDMVDASDNLVLPFEVRPLGVRGKLVRLGSVIDEILSAHAYPEAVSNMLAEAVALNAMLGTVLKFNGKLILQTATDGPIDMMVADYMTPGKLRGYARFDAERVAAAHGDNLLGTGHLAMTIDQGSDMERYQGLSALDGDSLVEAAHNYFIQSEQIPTRIALAAGPLQAAGTPQTQWRAGAIMVQHLPADGESSPLPVESGDNPHGPEEINENDNWTKARLLLDTVEAHELLDPQLTPQELLYRLYHEDGVTVYPVQPLSRHCTCSRQRISSVLTQFNDDEKRDMVEDDEVIVTCDFCSTNYRFSQKEVGLE